MKEVTVDDVILLILVEAGYEDKIKNFKKLSFQKILYENYEKISILKNTISFKTTGTYPYSEYIERVFSRFNISGVFKRGIINPYGSLSSGTTEFMKPTYKFLSKEDIEGIKYIANKMKDW